MYILTTTSKRKNAKRHIQDKSEDIQKLRRRYRFINEKYIVEIYNGKWELIESDEEFRKNLRDINRTDES